MRWTHVKKARIKRFFQVLDAARVESIVKYFDLRRDHRRNDGWSDCFDVSDGSAYPSMGLTKRRKIDSSIFFRTAKLLPAAADYFDFHTPMDLGRFVNSVVSCAVSTQIASRQSRTGHSKPQIIRAFENLRLQYKKLESIFVEYPEIRYAFNEVSWMLMRGSMPTSLDAFKHIPDAHLFIEIILRHVELDIKLEGESGRFLKFDHAGAKPKLNCVDRTAFICKRFNGPRVVTTPGSNYSFLCALFFEIATNKNNESMQGAIINLLSGNRPELYWFAVPVDDEIEKFDVVEGDIWAAKFEARRATILANVAAQFREDPSIYKDLVKKTTQQIRFAEEWVTVAANRPRISGLGEPVKKNQS